MNSEVVKSWTTTAGYPAQVRKGYLLCGYVGVEKGHPLYGKGYDDVNANVHGGLTYADLWPDGLWWLGFDTGHFGDSLPILGGTSGKKWTVEEVAEEAEELAQHIALMGRQLSHR